MMGLNINFYDYGATPQVNDSTPVFVGLQELVGFRNVSNLATNFQLC